MLPACMHDSNDNYAKLLAQEMMYMQLLTAEKAVCRFAGFEAW